MENMQVSWWKVLCEVQGCCSRGYSLRERIKVFVLGADAKLWHVPSLDEHGACCTLVNINTLSGRKQLPHKPRREIQSISFATIPKQWTYYLLIGRLLSVGGKHQCFSSRLHVRTHPIVRITDIYNEYLKTAHRYIWHGLLIKCWWLHRLYSSQTFMIYVLFWLGNLYPAGPTWVRSESGVLLWCFSSFNTRFVPPPSGEKRLLH